MSSTFQIRCSGSGDLITAGELLEILILILPEVDVMKTAFIKWISMPQSLKLEVENKLQAPALSTTSTSPSKSQDRNLQKGYSMCRVLLRAFQEWNHIQDTLGAPGIQPGFTALPKRLEMDISFMMKCIQEVTDAVIREHQQQSESKPSFMDKLRSLTSKIPQMSPQPTKLRASVSDTTMHCQVMCAGDHAAPNPIDLKRSTDSESDEEEELMEETENDTGVESGSECEQQDDGGSESSDGYDVEAKLTTYFDNSRSSFDEKKRDVL